MPKKSSNAREFIKPPIIQENQKQPQIAPAITLFQIIQQNAQSSHTSPDEEDLNLVVMATSPLHAAQCYAEFLGDIGITVEPNTEPFRILVAGFRCSKGFLQITEGELHEAYQMAAESLGQGEFYVVPSQYDEDDNLREAYIERI